jgi:branched-chain amino acid transport system substrate-binding protein
MEFTSVMQIMSTLTLTLHAGNAAGRKGKSMRLNLNSPFTRRTFGSIAAAGVLAASLTACGGAAAGGGAAGGGNDPYKVGVLVGLTGSYAALGEPERKAIELYFDGVNAAGGINGKKVELIVLDSTSDEGNAVNQLRKLATQDKVHAVLGPSSSGESIALKSFAKSLKVPVITLASSSAIVSPAADATYIFKEYTDTKLSLQAQLALAKEKGWKKVAVLATNDGYGQDAVKTIDPLVKEAGVELVANEVFNATATDVTPQLSKIGAASPDVVLVWAVNPANAIVAKSAASINFKPTLFHSPGAGSPAYIQNAGAAGEGTLLQGSKVLAAADVKKDDPQYEVVRNLVDKYTAKYNEAPGQYSANGWDGAMLLENALKNIKGDSKDLQATRDAIRDSLENNTKDLTAVNAVYTFTPEYHGPTGLTGLTVLAVKDGKFVVEKTY